jgi:methyl-accepting chemotaxis protein
MKTNHTSGPGALAALEQLEGLSTAVESVAESLHALGTNGATSMGAIELLSKEVMDGAEKLSSAVNGVAQAIENGAQGLNELVEAVYAVAVALEKNPGKTEADRKARDRAEVEGLRTALGIPSAPSAVRPRT